MKKLTVVGYLVAISAAVIGLGPIWGQLLKITGNNQISPANDSQTVTVPGNTKTVDYLYPGEAPHWLGAVPPNTPKWIDIPIASNQVTIQTIRFIVADESWTFDICESKTWSRCNFGITEGTSSGWVGDYNYAEAPILYVDHDGTQAIHVRVQGTDWFTFRALVNYLVN